MHCSVTNGNQYCRIEVIKNITIIDNNISKQWLHKFIAKLTQGYPCDTHSFGS